MKLISKAPGPGYYNYETKIVQDYNSFNVKGSGNGFLSKVSRFEIP